MDIGVLEISLEKSPDHEIEIEKNDPDPAIERSGQGQGIEKNDQDQKTENDVPDHATVTATEKNDPSLKIEVVVNLLLTVLTSKWSQYFVIYFNLKILG